MITILKKYYNYIITYLRKPEKKYLEPVVLNDVKQEEIKTNLKNLQDLLLYEYALKFLEDLRTQLEEAYKKLRILEKEAKPHADKHRKIVQKMHIITQDITKIETEYYLLKKKKSLTQTQINKDLQIETNTNE